MWVVRVEWPGDMQNVVCTGFGESRNTCGGEIDEIALFLCFLLFSSVFCFVFSLFFAKLMLFLVVVVVVVLDRVFCSVASAAWVRFLIFLHHCFLRFDVVDIIS